MPESETPEELWKWEEVNEAQVEHWLGMLEVYLKEVVKAYGEIRAVLGIK